jgi:ABC-type Zn uptake system ZnuABC Zn-binding protein ZnuA
VKKRINFIFSAIFIFPLLLTACANGSVQSGLIKVVATTTLVGDIVKQIGGNRIDLTVLYPVGADPHTFEPRPQDAASIADAKIVFLNGLGLEQSLEPLLNSNASGTVVKVSDGIDPLPFSEILASGTSTSKNSTDDPHTWMDPNLVMVWVKNISAALSKADPKNADYYAANSKAYLAQLVDLDQWIQTQVATLSPEKRKLVTDHENLGYFVHRYGFTLVGLVVDSLSTGASPSAQDLSKLETTIHQQGVKAIFVGTTVNPALSEQVARDTGVKLISINTESLGDEKSGISSYIQFMHVLVTAIVQGLQ